MIISEIGMAFVTPWTSRRPARALLAAGCGIAVAMAPIGAAADAASPAADVDALWNQPQGTRVDSAFYIVQAWWDGLALASQRDPRQRGLRELAQANEDLLNAYTLLEEQRNDPGPHPVPGIDPLLSGVYGFITGVHGRAPIGSVLSWMNQGLLHLEGRGSTETIIRSLLLDSQKREAAASTDLQIQSGSAVDLLWSANAKRESAILLKIQDLAPEMSSVGPALAATKTPTDQAVDPGKSNQGKAHEANPRNQPSAAHGKTKP
jgi:hypothetical protein